MLHKLTRAAALTAGLVVAAGAFAVATPKDDMTVEQIMSKAHNKKKGLEPKIKTAVKAGKWDDAGKAADDLKDLGAALLKTKAEKGPQDSWKKLTDQYAKDTAAVAEAAKSKDAKATDKALSALDKRCDACHSVHRD